MEPRELMEPRQVVDEVVDAQVESEVAYLEVCPTQVDGLIWCHRVGGWMVMCQWVGGMEGDGSMCVDTECGLEGDGSMCVDTECGLEGDGSMCGGTECGVEGDASMCGGTNCGVDGEGVSMRG